MLSRIAFLCLFFLHAAFDPLATRAESVLWRINSTQEIAGIKVDALGEPRVLGEAEGGPAVRFDGEMDALLISTNPIQSWKTFTIEVVFFPEPGGAEAQRFLHIEDGNGSRALMETRVFLEKKSWCLDTFLSRGKSGSMLRDVSKLHPLDQWARVALVYDGKRMSQYVNGKKEMERKVEFGPMSSGRMSLGMRLNHVYWFKGRIREIRFTRVTKTALQ